MGGPAWWATSAGERTAVLPRDCCPQGTGLLPSSCSGSLTFLAGQDAALFLQGLEVESQELLGLAGLLPLVEHLLECALQPLDGGAALAQLLGQLCTGGVDERLALEKGSEKPQGRAGAPQHIPVRTGSSFPQVTLREQSLMFPKPQGKNWGDEALVSS